MIVSVQMSSEKVLFGLCIRMVLHVQESATGGTRHDSELRIAVIKEASDKRIATRLVLLNDMYCLMCLN